MAKRRASEAARQAQASGAAAGAARAAGRALASAKGLLRSGQAKGAAARATAAAAVVGAAGAAGGGQLPEEPLDLGTLRPEEAVAAVWARLRSWSAAHGHLRASDLFKEIDKVVRRVASVVVVVADMNCGKACLVGPGESAANVFFRGSMQGLYVGRHARFDAS